MLLVATLCASATYGQPLGTLFHTPDERARLDRQRAGVPVGEAVPPREPAITGYVKRSDGKSTVFLDDRPHRLDSRPEQSLLTPRLFVPSGEARPAAPSKP